MAKQQKSTTDALSDAFATAQGVNGSEPRPRPSRNVDTKHLDTRGKNQGEEDEEEDENQPARNPYSPGHPMYERWLKSQRQGGDDTDDDADDDADDDDNDDPSKKKAGKVANKDNPERFEYWQAQFTKMQRLNEQLLDQLNGTQQGAPRQQQTTVVTPEQEIKTVQTELGELKAPSKPAKPTNYNATDAMTDPDSDSFRYRIAMEEYRDSFDEYSEKRLELQNKLFEAKTKMLSAPIEQMTRERQLNAQQQKVVDNLQKDHKFTQAEAVEFVDMMSKPESLSMDNLVALFRMKKGIANPNSSQRREDNRFPRGKAAPPIPSGSGASGGDDFEDDEDLSIATGFTKGLLKFTRR